MKKDDGNSAGPLFDRPWNQPEASRLEMNFWTFHRANPWVYDELVKASRQWKTWGGKKVGMQLLFERVRWVHARDTQRVDDFKINNNHAAYYSRLIMLQEPDLADFYEVRRLRVPCSFWTEDEGETTCPT